MEDTHTEDSHSDASTTSSKDAALLKLVNLLFDTPDNLMPQLTRLSRREVLPLSLQMMKESVFSPDRIIRNEEGHIIGRIPLTRIWRLAYMKLLRSVEGKHFMLGAGLAHEQASAEAEKAEEEMEL